MGQFSDGSLVDLEFGGEVDFNLSRCSLSLEAGSARNAYLTGKQ